MAAEQHMTMKSSDAEEERALKNERGKEGEQHSSSNTWEQFGEAHKTV